MIIHVAHHEPPFAQIDKRTINDPRLSWAATGLLTYLLAKPPHWQVHVRQLVHAKDGHGCGRDGVLRLLGELRTAGYAVLNTVRNPDGTFAHREWVVYERPQGPDVPQELEGADVQGARPQPELPDPAEPDTAKPSLSNTVCSSNTVFEGQTADFSSTVEEEKPVEPEPGVTCLPHEDTAPAPPAASESRHSTDTSDDTVLVVGGTPPGPRRAPQPTPYKAVQLTRECLTHDVTPLVQSRSEIAEDLEAVKRLQQEDPGAYAHYHALAWPECLARANNAPAYVGTIDLALTIRRLWREDEAAGVLAEAGPPTGPAHHEETHE